MERPVPFSLSLIFLLSVARTGATAVAPDPEVTALATQGRSQYLAGDSLAAESTFQEVAAREPHNAESDYFLQRIKDDRERASTRETMLQEVNEAWRRP